MSDGVKTPRPIDLEAFEKEESSVRSRPGAPRTKSGSFAAASQPPPSSQSMAERSARIEQKMAIATSLLKGMSPLDARARLLSSAILRRDEVLLDAILSGMAEAGR